MQFILADKLFKDFVNKGDKINEAVTCKLILI
jgi:hypothetical protein